MSQFVVEHGAEVFCNAADDTPSQGAAMTTEGPDARIRNTFYLEAWCIG